MKEQNEKQTIEEMYKDIYEAINHNSVIDLINGGFIGINTDGLTRELYDDGYRKQSENAVEVVRCKNCVYFKQSVSALFPHTTAFICDFLYGLQKNVSENDFCCHGAKMKGGAE